MTKREATNLTAKIVVTACGLLAVVALAGILTMLLVNAVRAFQSVSILEFFTSSRWEPSSYDQPSFGILPILAGTLVVTLLAMLLAVPIGLGAAAYLSEIAPDRVREIGKPMVEMLAAVPSVAIGFLGIVLVGPWIARTFGLSNGLNLLNGAILLAVMSLPTIISVAEDAIRAVPQTYREASLAIGGTRWQTLAHITLPSAGSGLIAAVILGMGRALGETMTVLMATGNAPLLPGSPFDSVRTITATIAIELGEVPYGSPHYHSLFAIGAVLFLMSLGVNLLAERLAAKRRRFGS